MSSDTNLQSKMLAAQHLGETHLASLRSGEMLAPQRAFLLIAARDSRLGLILFTALGVLTFLNGPVIIQAFELSAFVSIFLALFMLVSFAIAAAFWYERRSFRKDSSEGKVETLEANFHVIKEQVGDPSKGQLRCFLVKGRERLTLADPLRPLIPLLEDGPRYRVYVSPRTRQVLAMEIADALPRP